MILWTYFNSIYMDCIHWINHIRRIVSITWSFVFNNAENVNKILHQKNAWFAWPWENSLVLLFTNKDYWYIPRDLHDSILTTTNQCQKVMSFSGPFVMHQLYWSSTKSKSKWENWLEFLLLEPVIKSKKLCFNQYHGKHPKWYSWKTNWHDILVNHFVSYMDHQTLL